VAAAARPAAVLMAIRREIMSSPSLAGTCLVDAANGDAGTRA